ncbi:MAG: SGNH/GDSL hydrolase family protein [Bryobacterales bacterium]|nr:SGNH/GDSL hydrolase family protein [Bryobacterales bacterium]
MTPSKLIATLIAAAVIGAAVSPTPSKSPTKKTKVKKYVSSAGKAGPAADSSKPATAASSKAVARRAAPKPPPVPTKLRESAHDFVFDRVANGADIPVENAPALIPFFEQLYRRQDGSAMGPLRILQYGDSHTAADEWTGELRNRFQERFGDGGSGFSLAGRPYAGYRRADVRSGSTRGWHTDGLAGHSGDGIYGLGGISMSVRMPHEDIYVEAEANDFELFYYQQPGGGTLQLYDNGVAVDRIPTDGEPAPGYYHLESAPGFHRLELETLDRAPVRLFGWVAEKVSGVTYETLGINGAEAPIVLGWNQETLKSNIERRSPSLIVLAYGTNEAGHKIWTLESYREKFSELLSRIREAAPTAAILVVGPPDRDIRIKRAWTPLDGVDMIVEAQREAAKANRCAFWDLRAKMGGKGAMQQWVNAGLAANDHVHFSGGGYRMLGDAIFRDVISQYEAFLKARESILAVAP